ncbi:MAG: PAS domain S-box protein, partial [bacterium]
MCDALNNSIDIEILEEKYKLIFENARAGINIYEELPDGNRKLIECNQRYVEMSGYSRKELMECKNTTNLQVNLETLEQYLKNAENRSKGKPYNGIFSWIRPDGKENYIEYTAYSFQRGNRTFTVGIDRDITEQKEIERLINMQRDIALCLNNADNFNEAIDFCIKIILNTSKMDHCLVYLYNEKKESFELVFPLGVPEESVKTIYYFDRSMPTLEVVMQGKSIYDLNDAVDLISEKYRALMVENNINTLAIIPIKHKDTVIGCIVIASHSKIEINARLREALEMVSVQIGNAIIRLKAEESLRKSEARFRTIIENSSDAVELIEVDGTVIYSSPATSKISGYSLDELVGRNMFTVIDPDNRELLEELKNELFQNKKRTIKFEMRSRRKDGEWVWVEGTITNMLDSPNIGAIVTNYRDVTDRKIAENALKESEEKYRFVVENGNDAIVVAQDGRIKFANRRCQEITGYSEEELKSRPFIEFIFPEDREMVLENHLKRLRGEKIPNVYLFRIVRKDEDIIWVEINGVV